MTVSITGSSSAQPGSSIDQATSAVSPTAPVAKSVEEAHDSVKLSQAAQVHLFKQQGESASQIAANLGISTANVDSYLGIAVAKPAPAPAPAPVRAPSSSAGPTPEPAKS
jgi:hypothetical protein